MGERLAGTMPVEGRSQQQDGIRPGHLCPGVASARRGGQRGLDETSGAHQRRGTRLVGVCQLKAFDEWSGLRFDRCDRVRQPTQVSDALALLQLEFVGARLGLPHRFEQGVPDAR